LRVCGLVLAAGSSSRLGQPKQLLPYRGSTLLDETLNVARACGFDQLLVTVGGASAAVRERVDFTGVEVVENVEFTTGCSSSISAAIGAVDDDAAGMVLMLGDQPRVQVDAVRRLIAAAAHSPLGVCHYSDGRGHPFWFHRDVFDDLRSLHGDKAVWKLLESGRYDVADVAIAGPVPLDVDTWEDYEALLAQDAAPVKSQAT
jgi:molybdenum cofactor cytidylyltransferase